MELDTTKFAEAVLAKAEAAGVLSAGAAEQIGRRYRAKPHPDGLLVSALGYLAGDEPDAAMYYAPGRFAERPKSVVERIVAVLEPALGPGKAKALAAASQLQAGALEPSGAARVVFGHVHKEPTLLRAELRPEPPGWEVRVGAVLAELKRRNLLARDVNPAALAREPEWATIGRQLYSHHQIAREVLQRLRHRPDLVAEDADLNVHPKDPLLLPWDTGEDPAVRAARDAEVRAGIGGVTL